LQSDGLNHKAKYTTANKKGEKPADQGKDQPAFFVMTFDEQWIF
jgi:hypothetical protein